MGFLAIFLLIVGVLVGCGMGIGALVHWLVPAIDMGVGTLIGIVAMGFSLQLYGRLMTTLPDPDEEEDTEAPAAWRTTPHRFQLTVSRRRRRRKRS